MSDTEQWRELAQVYKDADTCRLAAETLNEAADTVDRLNAEVADLKRWKQAVDDALVVSWCLSPENENDPVKALSDLAAWTQKIALDPAVSSDARDLIQRGQMDATAIAKARIATLEQERDYAENALLRKGYRKSCDVTHCNCGDSWSHGGHAEQRLYELREAFEQADVSLQGKTLLTALCETLGALERQQARIATLEALVREAQPVVPDSIMREWQRRAAAALGDNDGR